MALGADIDWDVVKALLGDATDNYFLLCTSNKINKWSKYKPIRSPGVGADWPVGDLGTYALNVPTNWNYLQPRGGSPGGSPDEPARLDDFRGYEHSKALAFPTIQCRDTDNSFNAVIYPTGSPWLQRWQNRAFRSASSVLIIPSDLGMDNYYIGLKLSFAGATWYKTFLQVHDLTSAGTPISVSSELVTWLGSPAFSNLPFGKGTCDWQLIISENAATSWQNTLSGAVVYFPEDSDGTNTFISSGSFNVADWVIVSSGSSKVTSLFWTHNVLTYQGGTVYAIAVTGADFSIYSYPAWITAQIYAGGSLISNPTLYATTNELRLTPSQNFGVSREGDVVLHSPDGSPFIIHVTQGEAPGSDPLVPYVTVMPMSGESFSIDSFSGSIAIGSSSLTYTFTPSGGYMPGGTSCDISIINENTLAVVATDTIIARDGYLSPLVTGDRTITISETAVSGARYTVRVSIT